MTTDEFLEAVRLYAEQHFPRRPAVKVDIRLSDGDKKSYSLPDVPYKPVGRVGIAEQPRRRGNAVHFTH